MTPPSTFSPDDAAKLDRGWPFCITLSDAPADNKRPEAAALKWVESIDPARSVSWPRALARRVVCIGPVTQFRAGAHPGQNMSGRTLRGIAPEAPDLDPTELLDVLRRHVSKCTEIYAFKIFDYCFALEALLDTQLVLAALLDGLDAMEITSPAVYTGTNLALYAKQSFVLAAAFMALRADDALRARTRRTLESLLQRVDEHLRARPDPAAASWWIVRHRAAWARFGADAPAHCEGLRHEDALLEDLLFAPVDEATLRRRAFRKSTWPISVRHAWLGGCSMLVGLHGRKPIAAQALGSLRDFGMLREPEVVDLMATSLTKPKLAPLASEWLRTHREFAEPCLRVRIDADGPLATVAQAALATLPRG